MKKLLILSLLMIISTVNCLAYRYAFDSIPEPLKKDANAVLRTNQMVFKLVDPGRAIVTYKQAFTILNEKSDDLRYYYIFYDAFSRVSDIKASVYDKKGKLIEVISPLNILDLDASSGLASDQRVKRIAFPVNKYPFTIEVEYRKEYNSLIGTPQWYFQTSTDISVEQSGVQFIIPKDINFRFREFYLNNKVDSSYVNDNKIYTWVERNLPAIRSNYFIPVTMVNRPMVLTAMDDFECAGYPGSMKSWKSYGEWTYKLIQDLDKLPDDEIQKIKSLVSNITDEREKVKALYKYMQSRTRFVSINFGIGGLKPFQAGFVSEKGYGDCKALSNYMYSILKSVGIKSYYTYVNAGSHKDIITDFVYDSFNHVILCVPSAPDTIWLECTNQTMPFDFLGDFTCDRNVLLITPAGGVLAKTPPIENNTVVNVGTIDIKRFNECTGNITTTYYGLFYDNSLGLLNESEDEIKRSLNMSLPMGTFTIPTVNFTDNNGDSPFSELAYTLRMRDFTVSSSSRFHFYPCINKMDFMPTDSAGLKIYETKFYLDSITYNLPAGYDYENIPEDIEIDCGSGKFTRKIIIADNGSLIFVRSLILRKGVYHDKEARELYSFIRVVAKADHQKVILKGKVTT